jgi:hypothetical protein
MDASSVPPVKTARPAKTTRSRTVRAMGAPERGKELKTHEVLHA